MGELSSLPQEYLDAVEKMLAEQRERAQASQEKMMAPEPKEKEWEVWLPKVRYHRPKGSAASTGYAKGQIETVGRGTRHMSHPPDNEKVPIKT